jgi:hypothetical protein
MYIIKDAEGYHRACGVCFETSEEAIMRGPDCVHMGPKTYPEEFPFSVVDLHTGEVVHTWELPK